MLAFFFDFPKNISYTVISSLTFPTYWQRSYFFISSKLTMRTFGFAPVDNFLLEKRVNEGLSVAGLAAYFPVCGLLLNNDIVDGRNFATYTPQNFRRLLADMFVTRTWSSNTYNSYHKYFRVFCDYLVRDGYLADNPLVLIKKRRVQKSLPRSLSEEQVSQLKRVLKIYSEPKCFLLVRNATILFTYLYTGLRRHELLVLTLDDFDSDAMVIRVRHGKGDKDRVVPIPDILGEKLFSYLRYRREIPDLGTDFPLFCSRTGHFLQERDIRNFLQDICVHLSFRFTCHQLRHTYATTLVQHGVNLYTVSKILGHSRTTTTEIYLSFDNKKAHEELNRLMVFS